ncbi:hypothetical protein F0562_010973 [Nyssa sinensis]|uniref:Uncharacterized protein n=1 Tax=Nyssa sinensis TaxID=561372 RepID=A0A5J5A269_9ASTE|nr:hypothetical protein F0562_010973 [Nyssa sinensis]
MSKLPSIGPKRAVDSSDFDIEQPPPPSEALALTAPSFELTDQMPHLTEPKVIASMRLAISQVYKAVIQLDEMHEAYKKMLKDAEQKLVKIYESAATSGDTTTVGLGEYILVADEVNEEVVGIL